MTTANVAECLCDEIASVDRPGIVCVACREELGRARAEVERLEEKLSEAREQLTAASLIEDDCHRLRAVLAETPQNVEALRVALFGAELEPQALDLQAALHERQRTFVRRILAALRARAGEPTT